jgi:hypothetical protein
MTNLTRSTLQAFGMLGAVLIALATFVSWYSYEVVFAAGRVVHVFQVPVDLWGPYTLAAILLLAGAVFGLVFLSLPASVSPRAAGLAVLAIAIAIGVWALIRCLDIPSLGVNELATPARGATASTVLDGGPFLALAGAVMLAMGSLSILLPAREAEEAGAPAAARGTPPTGAAPAL